MVSSAYKYINTLINIDIYTLSLSGANIPINQQGIAWQSDIKNKFKAPPNAANIQWTDVTNGIIVIGIICY